MKSQKEIKLKRNFIWNAIGSMFNASTSLFFLILVTRINGVDNAGIFTFSFSLACLFQVIGTYSGRVYQVTETDPEISDSDYIYSKYILIIIMILLSIFFSIIKGYTLYKILIIICLVCYKAVEAFSESIYAVIQKNNDLDKVGKSLFLKGLLGIIIFFIIDLLTHNIIFSSFSLIISNFIILYFYDLKNMKMYSYIKKDFNINKVFKIFKFGLYTFLFTILTQYLINVPKYAIDNHLSDTYQTIFGIIVMPATVVILCSQFLVHPFLTMLSKSIDDNNIKKFTNTILKLSVILLLLGLIADIVAYFIGIPFLQLIYGIELKDCVIPLIFIISGAIFYGITYILSVGLITIRKTFAQVIIYFLVSIISTIIANHLVENNLIYGASLSYLVSMFILLIMYIIIFTYYIKRYKLKEKINND